MVFGSCIDGMVWVLVIGVVVLGLSSIMLMLFVCLILVEVVSWLVVELVVW